MSKQASQRRSFEWLDRYQVGFDRIGLVVLESEDAIVTRYYWDEDAREQPIPKGQENWISILKRKSRPAGR